MNRFKLVTATLLFATATIAQAQTSGSPSQPSTQTQGAQGAASVEANLDANKSDGKATKGLTNAEQKITAKHGKAHATHDKGKTERAEHSEKVERADKPEHSERPGH